MDIYSSDKAVSYVYICTHKETGKFYIGYRMRNVTLNIPSHLDLPKYKTSSTKVRPDWEDYTWTIVAEFFDPSDAYTFEQQLIYDNWENSLLLNERYNLGERGQFRSSGPQSPEHIKKRADVNRGKPTWNKGIPHSTETKQKMSDTKKGKPGKPCSDATKQKLSDDRKGKPNGRKGIPTGQISWNKGIPHSDATKQKLSDDRKGKPNGRKGIPTGPNGKQQNPAPKVECPHCGKIGGSNTMQRWHFDNCSKKPI